MKTLLFASQPMAAEDVRMQYSELYHLLNALSTPISYYSTQQLSTACKSQYNLPLTLTIRELNYPLHRHYSLIIMIHIVLVVIITL